MLGTPAFLAALALLGLNDWVLKTAAPSVVTGKLSDFAGLFAFGSFLAAFDRRRTPLPFVLAGALFAAWKSPVSEPLLRLWNQGPFWTVGRVTDATDLFALAVLPLAYINRRRGRALALAPAGRALAVGAAVVLFAATTGASYYRFDRTYSFSMGREDLVQRIDATFGPHTSSGNGSRPDSIRLWIGRGPCGGALSADFRVAGTDSASMIRLVLMREECSRRTDTAPLVRVFEDSVIARLRVPGTAAERRGFLLLTDSAMAALGLPAGDTLWERFEPALGHLPGRLAADAREHRIAWVCPRYFAARGHVVALVPGCDRRGAVERVYLLSSFVPPRKLAIVPGTAGAIRKVCPESRDSGSAATPPPAKLRCGPAGPVEVERRALGSH